MQSIKTLKFFSGNLHAFTSIFLLLTIEIYSKKIVIIERVDMEI
jgi:hypothetical protein